MEGTAMSGITQPWFRYTQAVGRSVGNGEQEFGGAHGHLEGRAHEQIEHRHVGPASAKAEHARHNADGDEQQQASQSAVGFPLYHFTSAGFKENAVHAKRKTNGILLGHYRAHGIFGKQQKHGNAKNGGTEAGLDDMGGQSQTEHCANDCAGRSDQRHRQSQAQVCEVTPQQTGTSCKCARKRHQQARASHEVEVEGGKPLTSGTNRTPPPTPAITAITPRMKQKNSNARGQNHQGWLSMAAASSDCEAAGAASAGAACTEVSAAATATKDWVWV